MALGINSVTRSSVEKNLLRVKSSAARNREESAVVMEMRPGMSEAMWATHGTAMTLEGKDS